MRWIFLLPAIFISCQNNEQRGANQDDSLSVTTNNPDSSISQKKNEINKDYLVIPGKSIGKIEINSDAANLEDLLGPPTSSDAAMGKAWMTWKGNRDEHNNQTELNVFTSYKDNSMDEKIVRQIRTTSSSFATSNNIKVYSALNDISIAFPKIKKTATYTHEDGREIIIYEDMDKGIAFEIVEANQQQICTGIIVYDKETSVTEIYTTKQPGLKKQ